MTPGARDKLDGERVRQSANGDIPGAELRAVRDFWGVTRVEFGEIFNVSTGTVFEWERRGVSDRNQKFNRATFRVLRLGRDLLADHIGGVWGISDDGAICTKPHRRDYAD